MVYRVTCISKDNGKSLYEVITHVGGYADSDGTYFKFSREEAIRQIESGKSEFYVHLFGDTVKVVVAVSASGSKYLKTVADEDRPNYLLNLPKCP